MLTLMASPEQAIQLASSTQTSQQARQSVDSPAGVGSLFEGSMRTVHRPREDIFLEGDEATHVFEVLEGVVCAYRLLSDGHRHVVSFYFPGDLLGYCCIGSYPYNAQGLSGVKVRRIPRASIDRLLEDRPDVARRLLKLAADELMATRDHLLCVASKSAESKMAAFLCALSRRNEDVGEDARHIVLPMTRIDIGDYLGLTIETVSRTLSKFKRAGIISLPRTTLVVINDLERLEHAAEV